MSPASRQPTPTPGELCDDLRRLLSRYRGLVVRVRVDLAGGERVTLSPPAGTVTAIEVAPPAPPPTPAALAYSGLEAKILAALAGGGWLTADEIATATGENVNGDLRAVLRNLGERNALENSTRHGWRLRPAGAPP